MVALATDAPEFTDLDRRAIRAAAFVDECVAFPLLGLDGRPLGPRAVLLTPARFNLLALSVPHFVVGQDCSRRDVLQVLWVLSRRYSSLDGFAALLFRLRWTAHSWSPLWRGEIITAVHRWHRLQLIDRPAAKVGSDGAATEGSDRWFASSIDVFARRIPWLGASAAVTPYARMFQILSEQDQQRGSEKPRFNSKRDQRAKAYLLRKRQADIST